MKLATKLVLALSLATVITACENKNTVQVEPKTPAIPTLTVNQIMDMSKNERQELERRCLGVTHETCAALKSESFETLKRLRISMCNVDASYKGLTDSAEAARARRKCDDLF